MKVNTQWEWKFVILYLGLVISALILFTADRINASLNKRHAMEIEARRKNFQITLREMELDQAMKRIEFELSKAKKKREFEAEQAELDRQHELKVAKIKLEHRRESKVPK